MGCSSVDKSVTSQSQFNRICFPVIKYKNECRKIHKQAGRQKTQRLVTFLSSRRQAIFAEDFQILKDSP